MQAPVFHHRVLRLLSEERATHGHGTAAVIDRRLGKSEGYLGRLLRGEIGLQVEMLGRVLEVLEVDPADFFARVVGTRIGPLPLVRRLERRLSNSTFAGPSPLDRGLVRRIELLRSKRSFETSQPPEEGADPGTLDVLCFSDPSAAAIVARRALGRWASRGETISSEALPPDGGYGAVSSMAGLLGVLASVDRIEARFRSAAAALRLGFELLENETSSQWAELVQRTAYLMADQGEHRSALDLVRQAGEIHVARHDLPGVGRAQVQKAVFLYHLDELSAARQAYRSGLEYLAPDAWTWRFAAYQGLGLVAFESGRLDGAERWARRAADEHRTAQGQNWWRLRWLEGRVAHARGLLELAESALSEARDGFASRSNPFDLALVSLDLARVLLDQARPHDVRKLTAGMMALLQPLRRHRVATSALHELARASLCGELSIATLDQVARTLGGCHPAHPIGRQRP